MATAAQDPDISAPGAVVEQPAPVRKLDGMVLRNLGASYRQLFQRYAAERLPAEQQWLKNLRQIKGVYDPDIERQLPLNRSRAYPRVTRVKCVSLLSRIMNLMFPGNEDNWELTASPSPEMDPQAVAQAVQELVASRQQAGLDAAISQDLIDAAVRALADKQAAGLATLIKDQLQELGGDQTLDWIALNRKVVQSGIHFGIGVLEGPYVRQVQQSGWALAAQGGFQPVEREIYKPQYDFVRCWDFYPDMSAQTLPGEGYFLRKIVSRAKLRKLADRPDFFGDVVREVLTNLAVGNYQAKSWENELKTMGLSVQTQQNNYQTSQREKYEVIVWKGPVSAQTLREAGADVPDQFLADDVEAELWLIENYVIKAAINPWRKLGIEMKTVHVFNFDEDDTSPISQGLPYVVRDSQMSVCASARATLDNASVVCGPNLEVNTQLMRLDQDLSGVQPYKIWYRDDSDPMTAQFPAVRQIQIDGHLPELQGLIKLFLDFAEMETFIGPSTGGDMTQVPAEAMRTAAGSSMLRGDAALPFKDIVRNYDTFTQSVIESLVGFNKQFNADAAPAGDYNVIARGATSLIAKEVRGIQIDALSQTLTPEERDHVDERKFVEARFASRDLQGILLSPDQAQQNKEQRAQQTQQTQQQQNELMAATVRKTLSEAFKNITQGQKNSALTQAQQVNAAITLLEAGANDEGTSDSSGKAAAGSGKAG